MKLGNVADLASTAFNLLKEKTQSTPAEQPAPGPRPQGMPAYQNNAGKAGLMAKLNRNQMADKLDAFSEKIDKKNGLGMSLLFTKYSIGASLLTAALSRMASILRKGEKERDKPEQLAADYYGQMHPNAPPEYAASFTPPTFDQLNQDLRKMPTVRIGLMEAGGWQENDFRNMKESIDRCLNGMGDIRTAGKAITEFNNTSYPAHCGKMPEAREDYQKLSNALDAHLKQLTAARENVNTGETRENANTDGPRENANTDEARPAAEDVPKTNPNHAFPHFTGSPVKFSNAAEFQQAIDHLKEGGLSDDDLKQVRGDIKKTLTGAEMRVDDFNEKYGHIFAMDVGQNQSAFAKFMTRLPA